MIKRNLKSTIAKMAKIYPVIALTGPRQSGKTTVLRQMFDDYTYVSLENPDNRSFAQSDPNGFLRLYPEKVILDEVQLVPELFSYIQTIVDESRMMGQFILSGSQNFSLLRNITQSLAGRVALLKLLPFDFSELKSADVLPTDYLDLIVKGSYPAIYDRNIPSSTFYANYIETYVQRDLTELLNVRDLGQFRTFLKICAGRISQQLNLSNIATEVGISVPTVKSWLSILESSYIVFQLPPFFKNFNKRLVKSSKLYFYDTGLASFLLGIKKPMSLLSSEFKGPLFENLIISEYFKQSFHSGQYHDFYYWRESNGLEIDLMVSNDRGTYDIFEIKATHTIMPKLYENLSALKNIAAQTIDRKILVYGGETSQERTDLKVWSWNEVQIKY